MHEMVDPVRWKMQKGTSDWRRVIFRLGVVGRPFLVANVLLLAAIGLTAGRSAREQRGYRQRGPLMGKTVP
jgi:hypothetical protein